MPHIKGLLKVFWLVIISAGDIAADERLDISVAVCKPVQGNGRRAILSAGNLKFKASFVRIVSVGNTCLSRAIVVCVVHLKRIED